MFVFFDRPRTFNLTLTIACEKMLEKWSETNAKIIKKLLLAVNSHSSSSYLKRKQKLFNVKINLKFEIYFFICLFHEENAEESLLINFHGLVVKTEGSWPRGPGFKPPLWRPFFRHHSFGSKLGTKTVENSNLALLHVL